jgi:hypothetical protein
MKMNYRRGFQRVYLTLAGAWFVLGFLYDPVVPMGMG